MGRFPSNSSKKPLKQRLDFYDKKGLELLWDVLKFQAEKQLKQRLHFSDKKGLQPCSDFLQIQPKIETTVGFLR